MASRIVPNRAPTLEKKLDRNKRDKHEGKDPAYLSWLHQLPCCVSQTTAQIVAHHPTVGRGRMARKADDSTAVPLTERLHSDQYKTGLHAIGERKFWNLYGVDPTALADDLYGAFKAGHAPNVGCQLILNHSALASTRLKCGVKIVS